MSDAEQKLTDLTDRASGGTSRNEGEVEIMVSRVTTSDDRKGIQEPCYEFEELVGLHRLVFSSLLDEGGANEFRSTQMALQSLPVVVSVYKTGSDLREKKFRLAMDESLFGKCESLEEDKVRLDLDTNEIGEVFVRVYNMDEGFEKKEYNLKEALRRILRLEMVTLQEYSIDFSLKLEDLIKKTSMFDGGLQQPRFERSGDGKNFDTIRLVSLQVRAFKITSK